MNNEQRDKLIHFQVTLLINTILLLFTSTFLKLQDKGGKWSSKIIEQGLIIFPVVRLFGFMYLILTQIITQNIIITAATDESVRQSKPTAGV